MSVTTSCYVLVLNVINHYKCHYVTRKRKLVAKETSGRRLGAKGTSIRYFLLWNTQTLCSVVVPRVVTHLLKRACCWVVGGCASGTRYILTFRD